MSGKCFNCNVTVSTIPITSHYSATTIVYLQVTVPMTLKTSPIIMLLFPQAYYNLPFHYKSLF